MESNGKANRVLSRTKTVTATNVVFIEYSFNNYINVRVLHALLGYNLTGTEDGANKLLNGSIVCLARLYTWVGTMVKCIPEEEIRAGIG